ncbi:MAG: transposase, partial [Gammaproteobacteria bacterium]|nr:transposase [Gammaproteobacteria bacterium]
MPLNDANRGLEVNFLEWTGTKPNGDVQRFSWVTDVAIDESNAESLMRAGRARWRIENETF